MSSAARSAGWPLLECPDDLWSSRLRNNTCSVAPFRRNADRSEFVTCAIRAGTHPHRLHDAARVLADLTPLRWLRALALRQDTTRTPLSRGAAGVRVPKQPEGRVGASTSAVRVQCASQADTAHRLELSSTPPVAGRRQGRGRRPCFEAQALLLIHGSALRSARRVEYGSHQQPDGCWWMLALPSRRPWHERAG